MKVLVVEDDPVTRTLVAKTVEGWGHTVQVAECGDDAWQKFRTERDFDVVISDWRMPGIDGIELCRRIRQHDKDSYTYFVLLTVADSRDNRIHALEQGADDFLPKPLDVGELEIRLIVARRMTHLRAAVRETSARLTLLEEQAWTRREFEGMVGKSATMQEVFRRIRLAAQSDVTVYFHGESGTGKELAARAIHQQSNRRKGPFVAVNCAAIPADIMESELFGHVRGAFTGAVRDAVGLIAMANGGTVFLDEIGDLPLSLQSKLLRFLEERRVRPVGGAEDRPVDVRIVTATHRDIAERTRTGEFREDLYYRIRVFQIDLPPLRERRDDLPLLVDHFVAALCEQTGRAIDRVSAAGLRAILEYDWPGNIRELRNAIEHAFVIAGSNEIDPDDLPAEVLNSTRARTESRGARSATAQEIVAMVEATGGNRAEAARRLGVSRVALWKRIRKLGIDGQLPEGRSGRPATE